MKNRKIIMCLLLSFSFFLYFPFVRSVSGSEALLVKSDFPIEKQNSLEFVPGEILVKFKDGVNQSQISALNSYLQSKEFKRIGQIKVRRIKLPPDISVEDAVLNYKMDPDVEYAEPNYIIHLAKTPNDYDFNKSWGLHNTGQQINGITGTVGADIGALNAWDITTGSADVIIAVIDSGVAYLHPEIESNIWINMAEFKGLAGFDDDDNGYIVPERKPPAS